MRFTSLVLLASTTLASQAFAGFDEGEKRYWVYECQNTAQNLVIQDAAAAESAPVENEDGYEWVYQFTSKEEKLPDRLKNWCFKWSTFGRRCNKVVNRDTSAVVPCSAATAGQIAVTP